MFHCLFQQSKSIKNYDAMQFLFALWKHSNWNTSHKKKETTMWGKQDTKLSIQPLNLNYLENYFTP